MFKKLLSNLPYNPSLIGQVSFYSQRLKRESAIRRTGVITVALAVFVQTFAFIAPPQQTLANSNNDMIAGGISSKGQAVEECQKNGQYKVILAYYGISCDALNQTSTITLKSTDHGGNLFSMGHLAYGKRGETPVTIPGAKTMYLRYLSSWDTGASSSYKALKGTASNGKVFYILYSCGNLTFVGLPAPVAPPVAPQPNFTIEKTVSKASPVSWREDVTVKPQETVTFKITVKNTGNVSFKNVSMFDTPPRGLTLVAGSQKLDGVSRPNITISNFFSGSLDPGATRVLEFDAKATAASACGLSRLLKNEASAKPDELAPKADSARVQVCLPTQTPAPVPVVTPAPTPAPTPKEVPVTDVCPTTSGLQINESECKPCEEAQSSSDQTACIQFAKTASNTTKGLKDANGTTANANDVIKYTLSTKNSGSTAIKNYVVSENISDVLDYATVVDLHGGTIDANNIVSWPATTINGSQELKNTVTVRIKDPIPNTPISASDPGHYDLKMTNVYGNTVSVNLQPSIIKTTEVVTTTTLPNTGPGAALVIGFSTIFIATFFLARSILMRRELAIVQQDFATTGGY